MSYKGVSFPWAGKRRSGRFFWLRRIGGLVLWLVTFLCLLKIWGLFLWVVSFLCLLVMGICGLVPWLVFSLCLLRIWVPVVWLETFLCLLMRIWGLALWLSFVCWEFDALLYDLRFWFGFLGFEALLCNLEVSLVFFSLAAGCVRWWGGADLRFPGWLKSIQLIFGFFRGHWKMQTADCL